jgi:hypothetical protein
MKKLVLVLIVSALAVPAVAQAKGALGVEVCGADGCQQQRFASYHETGGEPFTGKGGIVTPAKPGPWLRGAILIGDPSAGKVFGRIPFLYVTGADLMVDPGDSNEQPAWWHPKGELATLVHALARKVTPFAAPKQVAVSVNGRAVQDPSSYLTLFTTGKRTDAFPKTDQFVQITFQSKSETPWTTGNDVLLYTADRLLLRDGEIVALSGSMSDRIAAGASLTPGSRIPWRFVALALAALAVVALTVAVRLRARPTPRPVPQA